MVILSYIAFAALVGFMVYKAVKKNPTTGGSLLGSLFRRGPNRPK